MDITCSAKKTRKYRSVRKRKDHLFGINMSEYQISPYVHHDGVIFPMRCLTLIGKRASHEEGRTNKRESVLQQVAPVVQQVILVPAIIGQLREFESPPSAYWYKFVGIFFSCSKWTRGKRESVS